MKNKRKSLIGLGLIMALSVYAGAATTSNLKNSKGNTETVIENNQKEFNKDKCPMPPGGHPGHEKNGTNGEKDKNFKRPTPERIEELKKILNKVKVTKAEAAEIIEIIELKGKGPHGGRPGGPGKPGEHGNMPQLNNNQSSNDTKTSN